MFYHLAEEKTIGRGVIRPPFRLGELTPSVERRRLSMALEPLKEESLWEFNRYRIGH